MMPSQALETDDVPSLMISGGKGGLAQCVQELFAARGWRVVAPSHAELDVRRCADIKEFVADKGPFDCVICNAGMTGDQLLARQTEARWDEVMEVNLRGAAWCAASVARGMKRTHRQGSIVLMGSYAAMHPGMGQALYAASKAGLEGLMKSLAREWGGDGIRVNLVLPGFMETPMTGQLPESVVEQARAKHVLGAFNTPFRVAEFLYFLHESMPLTSGQVFSLDSRIL